MDSNLADKIILWNILPHWDSIFKYTAVDLTEHLQTPMILLPATPAVLSTLKAYNQHDYCRGGGWGVG